MMDNSGPKMGAADGAAGIPYYEKQRQHLKELLNKKKLLEKRLLAQEESIYQKETEYLENTPAGNIITGFDNYTKGTANVAAQRRKTGLTDANRVFSRSSISYNPAAQQDSQTPASSAPASHAPTPVSTSFNNRDGASSAPTPTSATAGKANSKKKKAATSGGAGVEDSETDSRETKKARTNFGAVRK
ncbi:histone acetyltransferase subunit NuA4 domain-containing protein [Neurospora intermedia]|uniref:Chromatin modification-related protein EAF6 n=1 Tax=Neurospora intermedia TaxID=5142 RepID=A0ABR3DPA8_NEUIN